MRRDGCHPALKISGREPLTNHLFLFPHIQHLLSCCHGGVGVVTDPGSSVCPPCPQGTPCLEKKINMSIMVAIRHISVKLGHLCPCHLQILTDDCVALNSAPLTDLSLFFSFFFNSWVGSQEPCPTREVSPIRMLTMITV